MKHYANIERMKKMMSKSDSWTIAYHTVMGEVQQYMLYAASNDVFFGPGGDETRENRPKGITLEGAQALIDKVRTSEYARLHWPKFAAGPATTVTNDVSDMEREQPDSKPYGGAYTNDEHVMDGSGGAAIMHLADNGFAMQPQVVLHELGHVVEGFERPNFRTNAESHGAAFARTAIELIYEFMSPEKAKELESAFEYAKVQVAPATQSTPHMELR